MSETITAVYRTGTASGPMHNRVPFGTIRQDTYMGVPTGLYVIGRDGHRVAEVERTFEGWTLRIGDSTDMSAGCEAGGTHATRADAVAAFVRRELRARPDYVTVS